MSTGRLAVLGVLAALGGVGCSKPDATPVAYGDPVGVKIVDSALSPNGEIVAAFAVSPGHATEPLMPGVARAVSGALRACPAAGALFAQGQVIRIAARLERSVVVTPSKSTGNAEADCVRAQLSGQKLVDAQEVALDILFEIGSSRSAATP